MFIFSHLPSKKHILRRRLERTSFDLILVAKVESKEEETDHKTVFFSKEPFRFCLILFFSCTALRHAKIRWSSIHTVTEQSTVHCTKNGPEWRRNGGRIQWRKNCNNLRALHSFWGQALESWIQCTSMHVILLNEWAREHALTTANNNNSMKKKERNGFSLADPLNWNTSNHFSSSSFSSFSPFVIVIYCHSLNKHKSWYAR